MTVQSFTLGAWAQSGAGAAGSFESIATASGTGSSATITFSSIPSTYQHLQIRGIAKISNTGSIARSVMCYANSDTAANYARHSLLGDGSTVIVSGTASNAFPPLIYATGSDPSVPLNTLGAVIIDIHDYASTTKYKTFRSFTGADSNSATVNDTVRLVSTLWMNTNAITTLSLTTDLGNWTTQTSFALYGIKGA